MLGFDTAEIDAFWSEACTDGGIDPTSRRCAYTFAEPGKRENDSDINELSDLAARGQKRGTTHLRIHFDQERIVMREPGDYWIVTKTTGEPMCLVRITNIDIRPFNQVELAFAASEGEGDLTLEYWRDGHSTYFQEQCERWGVEWREDLPVVCESFDLVYSRLARRSRHEP